MTDYKIVCNFIGPPSQVTNLKTSVDCLICKDKKMYAIAPKQVYLGERMMQDNFTVNKSEGSKY